MDDQEYLANQELLQGANRKANLHNTLAAVAAMSNNPDLAAATKMAAADAQRQYAPQRLGAQGYMLPDTGEFVGSKLYQDEKKSAAEEKRALLASSLAAKAQADAQRSADKAEQRALMLTIAGMKSGDARYKVDNAPAKGAGAGKTLPPTTINKLSEAEGMATGFADLAAGFQDQYGGGYGTVGIKNFLGKNSPNSRFADQANWWQNYNDQKNIVRNKLFGSALTASEKKAFDDANITEGMEASEIKKRLGQQHAAAVRARNKLVGNYGGSGYDVSGFADMPEPDYAKPGAPSRATGGVASAAPAGVDPVVWSHMTPQEKALFK